MSTALLLHSRVRQLRLMCPFKGCMNFRVALHSSKYHAQNTTDRLNWTLGIIWMKDIFKYLFFFFKYYSASSHLLLFWSSDHELNLSDMTLTQDSAYLSPQQQSRNSLFQFCFTTIWIKDNKFQRHRNSRISECIVNILVLYFLIIKTTAYKLF